MAVLPDTEAVAAPATVEIAALADLGMRMADGGWVGLESLPLTLEAIDGTTVAQLSGTPTAAMATARVMRAAQAFFELPSHAPLAAPAPARPSAAATRTASAVRARAATRALGDVLGRKTISAYLDRETQLMRILYKQVVLRFKPGTWDMAYGSSGTVGAVSDVLRACGQTDGSITPDGLRWLMKQCIEAGSADRLDLPGLKPDRRPVLAGGLAILYTLAAHFQIDALQPAKGALRQGVIVDLHDRLLARQRQRGHDLREDSVKALQHRFGADVEQAQRVARLACALFDQVAPRDAEEERIELRWAALLHEIGQMVSHHDHHRHSAYLLGHVDAAGFSQSQQRRLADLVLGQRGGLRKMEEFIHSELMLWQVLCLRLAVIACHARADVPEQALRLQRQGRIARLAFRKDWAEAHPRTVHLLEEEEQAWARSELALALHLG